MKLHHVSPLLLLLAAAPVHAAGINLSWNDCGTSGLALKNFACNSNVGFHRLFTSFVSPVPMTQLVGMEQRIDVAYNQATVPSWWTMQSSGGCRAGTISASMNYSTGPFSCTDPWMPTAAGGATIQPGTPVANRARILAVAAVPSSTPMTVNDVDEYYAIEIRITNSKTVGGACPGCEAPACLLLTQIKLTQPLGVGDYLITQPLDDAMVGWQCPAFNGSPEPQCFQCPVKTNGKTWGAVKGLYR